MSDVFTDGTEHQDTTSATDPLADLVGEGKKYKTPADLAKAVLEKDRFIEQLKGENAEMRTEVQKQEYAKELLSKIQEKAATSEREPEKPRNTDGDQRGNQSSVGDIESLVEKAVTAREAKRTAEQNMSVANSEVIKLYGDEEKARLMVRQKAKELGLPLEKLQEIASQSPTAFVSLVGGTPSKSSTSGGTVNTAAQPNNNSGVRNNQFYQELRRKNKSQYFSQKVQLQMMKDRTELGEKFFQ